MRLELRLSMPLRVIIYLMRKHVRLQFRLLPLRIVRQLSLKNPGTEATTEENSSKEESSIKTPLPTTMVTTEKSYHEAMISQIKTLKFGYETPKIKLKP